MSSLDLEHFESHYTLRHPDLTEHMWEVVEHMQEHCPVAFSDVPAEGGGSARGTWVVTKYEDVFRVLQDWETFSSDYSVLCEAGTANAQQGNLPPITTDPPLQREFRRLLNPFLSPQAVAGQEPQVRRIVTELIDDFIEDGHCDLVGQLSYLHPPRMLYRILFGIDNEAQLRKSLAFTMAMHEAKDAESYARARAVWLEWIEEFLDDRRLSPRRPDIIDALLNGSVEGRPLSSEEVAGAISLLVMGGFFTTNDATSAAMLLLIEHPDVQEQLRNHPSMIPQLFDETLRLEPPVISLFRACTRDVELRGRQLRKGDAVLVHYGGANRDPDAFDKPAEMQMHRQRNRHLAFGAGPHRCVGSNVARLNLRIVFEEILARLHDIHITEGDAPRQGAAGFGWGLAYLPISFTPGKKILS
jgi:cytochrome P450